MDFYICCFISYLSFVAFLVDAAATYTPFWKSVHQANIVFPHPSNLEDFRKFSPEFMTIRDNDIILKENYMIDSKGRLINNKAKENPIQLPFKLPSGKPGLPDNWGGMLCLEDATFTMVSRKSKLLIRKPYLQLIEVLEDDRVRAGRAGCGCAIVGTPGIGKTYFGLYFLFYITRHYPNSNIIWQNQNEYLLFSPNHSPQDRKYITDFRHQLHNENDFYLVDSAVPYSPAFAYTLLFSSPRSERWNEFVKKKGNTVYYMPIWTPNEIWALWNQEFKDLPRDRIQELMNQWGPIPRIVFDKYQDPPNLELLLAKCKLEDIVHKVSRCNILKEDSYTNKLIHITVPNPSNFGEMYLAFASGEVAKELIRRTRLDSNRKVMEFIQSTAIYPEAGGIRGVLFEHLAHERLRKGGVYKIRRLENLKNAKDEDAEDEDAEEAEDTKDEDAEEDEDSEDEDTKNEDTKDEDAEDEDAEEAEDTKDEDAEEDEDSEDEDSEDEDTKNEDTKDEDAEDDTVTYQELKLNEYTTNGNIKKDVYNQPISKNNETVDSLVIDTQNKEILLFQMTVGRRHGAKVR